MRHPDLPRGTQTGSSWSLIPHVQVRTAREEAEAYPSLRKGGMGGRECKWSNEIFRGDHISFLHPQKERSSGNVGICAVLTALESLRPLLAAQGFPVDGRVTFQLASYPVRLQISPFVSRGKILRTLHRHHCCHDLHRHQHPSTSSCSLFALTNVQTLEVAI